MLRLERGYARPALAIVMLLAQAVVFVLVIGRLS